MSRSGPFGNEPWIMSVYVYACFLKAQNPKCILWLFLDDGVVFCCCCCCRCRCRCRCCCCCCCSPFMTDFSPVSGAHVADACSTLLGGRNRNHAMSSANRALPYRQGCETGWHSGCIFGWFGDSILDFFYHPTISHYCSGRGIILR